jgi:5S rRNA maturation endonuclease (ribonuclease M5)
VIEQILAAYTKITYTPDGYTITCPWCKEENRDKQIYFYRSGVVACFRCRDLKDRTWRNSFKALQEILTKLGVDKRKLQTFNGSIQYVDFGKGISKSIKRYGTEHEFTAAEDSEEIKVFLKERNLDINKVKDFIFLGIKGPMKDKVCFPLYPSGFQCRSLTSHDYRIYKDKHDHLVFSPDPISKVNDLFIVEGPKDSLNLYQYGYQAIATLGINTSPYIKQIIAAKEPQNIYLWFDPDEAGAKGVAKLAKFLISGFYDLFSIKYKEDPQDASENDIQEAILTAEALEVEEIFK